MKELIERALQKNIEELGPPGRLRDACAYALLNGGKRLRPLLVLLIGEALGIYRNNLKNREFDKESAQIFSSGASDIVQAQGTSEDKKFSAETTQSKTDSSSYFGIKRSLMPIALSVEYFHTASLIADDLPCMDNDSLRRGSPSLHVAFGESVALLTSYTLIAAGYGAVYEMAQSVPESDHLAVLALETITRCAGLRGATQGQFLDLFPPDPTQETLREVIEKKTVTLFEISFVLGWLFGGGDLKLLDQVRKCAGHFGFAFQIADDIQDLSQDKRSLVHAIGLDAARDLFEKEVQNLEDSLQTLGLWNDPFQEMVGQLKVYAEV